MEDGKKFEDDARIVSPVVCEPLLLIEGSERTVVAADIHLGLEFDLWLGGISIPSQTEKILERFQKTLASLMPDRLILLGDIKHNVPRTSWQEKKEVPDFLRRLSRDLKVDVVPGNHDSNIAEMSPSGVQVRASSGYVVDGVGYFHGHTWPDECIMRADLIVAAHLHPAIRLRDPVGSPRTQAVWARSKISGEAVKKHYGFSATPELIIMPAFNHLCGGLPLNETVEDPRGPLMEIAEIGRMHIYLLDGTYLGLLGDIVKNDKRD